MTATRVRIQSVVRQPVPTVHWTSGAHQPTALALAAPGLLGRVADRMGKKVTTLEKWAQGERGPERDLSELFPALRAAGVPRERAGLIVAQIIADFEAAYRADLPRLSELHALETARESAENATQMALVLADDDLDAQARHLPNVLAERSALDTYAAVMTRNLQAAGRM